MGQLHGMDIGPKTIDSLGNKWDKSIGRWERLSLEWQPTYSWLSSLHLASLAFFAIRHNPSCFVIPCVIYLWREGTLVLFCLPPQPLPHPYSWDSAVDVRGDMWVLSGREQTRYLCIHLMSLDPLKKAGFLGAAYLPWNSPVIDSADTH